MKLRLPLLLASALLATFVTYTTASGADMTWKGGAGDWDTTSLSWDTETKAWDNTANAGDTAVFGGSGGTVTLAEGSTINLLGLEFTVGGYTITGGTLNFGAQQGEIDSSALGTTGSNMATIASNLTGTNGVTIAAHGNTSPSGGGSSARLSISGDNTGLTGDITITAGTVGFANNKAAGAEDATAGTGNKIVLNGGGLIHASSGTAAALGNNIELGAAGATIRVYGSQTLVLNGEVSGSGNLTKTDGGQLRLTGTNTFSGNINVTGGTVTILNRDDTFTGTLTASTGGTVQLGDISNTGTFNYSSTSLTIDGGTLSLYGSSGGSVTHTYNFTKLAGPIKVDGGTVAFRSTNSTRKAFNGALEFSGDSAISYSSSNYTHNMDLNGNITGTGTLTFTWSGGATGRNVNINGTANNYTGEVILGSASGGVSMNANQTLGAADWTINNANWTVNMRDGEYVMKSLNNAADVAAKIRSAAGTTTILNVGSGNTDSVYAGQLLEASSTSSEGVVTTGKLTLVKTGTGSLTLSGTNEYTGGTEVKEGTLILASMASMPGSLTLHRGANLTVNDAAGFVLDATRTLHVTGAAPASPAPSVITGDLTLSGGTFTVDLASLGSSPTAFNGPLIRLTGGLTIGTGTTFGLTGNYTSESLPNLGGNYTIIEAGSITGSPDGSFIYVYPNQAFQSDFTYKLVTSGNSLVLQVTEQLTLVWNTASGNWNTADANWVKQGDPGARPFQTDARVLFNDAAGSGEHTVTITENVSPNAMSFENTTAATYIIDNNGGSLINNGALSKTGNGTVEFKGSNAGYTGNVSIENGTLKASAVNALGGSNTITLTGGNLELTTAGDILNATTKLRTNGGTVVYSGTAAQDISSLIDSASTGTVLVSLTGSAPVVWSNTGLDAIGKAVTVSGTGAFTGTIGGAMTQVFTSNTTGATTLNVTAAALDMSKIAGSSAITLNAAGAVALEGTAASTGALTLSGAGTYDVGDMSGLATPSGLTLSGTNITATGASYGKTLTISGSNTLAGDLTLGGALAGTAGDALAVNSGATLTLTGDFSGYAGTLTNNGTVNLGNGSAAPVTTISNTGLTGTGTYVVNYTNDVTLASAVGTGSSTGLTQAGTGKLTLTGASTSTGDLTVNAGSEVQLDGTGSWAGAIKGDGTLIANTTNDIALNNLTGGVALKHIGGNKVTLGSNAGTYTGDITLNSASGTGTLDLAGGAYSNNITLNAGKLANAENAGNINIAASGNVDLGGLVNTGNIKSLITTAGGVQVTGLGAGLTLSTMEVMVDTNNTNANGGTLVPVIVFDNAGDTLTLGKLDMNITTSLSSYLSVLANRGYYDFHVTNGTLAGDILTKNADDDYINIDNNGYLEAIGYWVSNVQDGTVTVSGTPKSNVLYVYSPESGLTPSYLDISNPSRLDLINSVFNEGQIDVTIDPASGTDNLVIPQYAGQDPDATMNITQAGMTVTLRNNDSAFTFKDETGATVTGTQNYGSIYGAGNIAKDGAYKHLTGGNVQVGGDITAAEGEWTIMGSVSGANLNVGTDGKAAELKLNSNAVISGTTTVGGDGTLNVLSSIQTGALDIAADGQMTLAGGNLVSGATTLQTGSHLTGNGNLVVSENGTLDVQSGADIADGITTVLGSAWNVNTATNLRVAGLTGTGGGNILNMDGDTTVTLVGNDNAEFVGQLTGTGNLVKKGTGVQAITATNDARTTRLDVREGTLVLKGEGAQYGDLYVGTPDGVDPEAVVYNNLSVNKLTVYSNGVLTLGQFAGSGTNTATQLTVNGDASFASGSTYNTVIPNSGTGVYATGTITLPETMNIILHNNSGIVTDANGNYPEFVIMTADGGYLWTNGDTITDNTRLYDATITPGLSLFITKADIYRKGNNIVADAKKADSNVLLNYADTQNSTAGAHLLYDAGIQSSGSNLANLSDSIMTDIGNGNIAGAKRTMSALAGSSYVGLLSAQQGAFRYQQNLIRNRMTGMGLNQGYQYHDLPFYNMWVQGNGSYDKLNSSGDNPGHELNSWGGTVGFDMNLTDKWTAGAAFTASFGKVKSSSTDSLDGDLDVYYLNLFTQYKYKAWTHSLILTGGWGEADVDRSVAFGDYYYRGQGKSDVNSYGAMYELTYDFALNKKRTTLLQPVFNASIMHNKVDDFAETGAGNANVRVSDLDSTIGTFGVGARLMGLVGSNVFGREAVGEFRALLVQDIGDDYAHGVSALEVNPGGGQRIRGSKIGRTGVQIGAGLTVPVGQQSSVFLDGNADVRSHSTSVYGSVGFRYNF